MAKTAAKSPAAEDLLSTVTALSGFEPGGAIDASANGESGGCLSALSLSAPAESCAAVDFEASAAFASLGAAASFLSAFAAAAAGWAFFAVRLEADEPGFDASAVAVAAAVGVEAAEEVTDCALLFSSENSDLAGGAGLVSGCATEIRGLTN